METPSGDLAKFAGNYFQIEAGDLKKIPSFSRCVTTVKANERQFWMVETVKKVTGRNPEWASCFGAEHRVKLMTRPGFIDAMKAFAERGQIVAAEGASTVHHTGPASIGVVNKQAKTETNAANRKRKLREQMETLATSKDWLKAKYAMLLDDPEVLHKWSVIKEGAFLLRLMNQQEKNHEWVKHQKLRKWQAQLMGEMDAHGPDDRSVFWVMDAKGGSGKTWFTKYMYKIDPTGTAWLQNGKTHDLIKIIADQAINLKLVMFDLCRSNEERINWDAIERIKNGMIMSTKYEVESIIIDSPAVVCFANFEPELKRLSLDRWRVYEIRDHELYRRDVGGTEDSPVLQRAVACNIPIEDLIDGIGVEVGESG